MSRKLNSSPLSRSKPKKRKSNRSLFQKKIQKSAHPPQARKSSPNSARALKSEQLNQNKSSPKQKRRTSPPNRYHKQPLYILLLVAFQLLAIAVGLSTILGTAIAIANSFNTPLPEAIASDSTEVQIQTQSSAQIEALFPIASLGKELPDLELKIENLAANYPQLEPEIFLVDLDSKGYVNINGRTPISAASTIKLPILVAFLQDVDSGKIALEEKLTITKELIGGGSGGMQYEQPGTQYTALKTASQMMTVSDNTATNMLIERMGGIEALNQRFMDWGLDATRLRNPLPDLTGTNTTSPEDLGNLLAKIDAGELISLRSRDRLLYIMRNTVRNTLLPQGLNSDALIAHKTGDIKSVLGDVGIIDLPNGKRYIAAVLVKRPDNDPQAKEFIQKMSKVAYDHFHWYRPRSFTVGG